MVGKLHIELLSQDRPNNLGIPTGSGCENGVSQSTWNIQVEGFVMLIVTWLATQPILRHPSHSRENSCCSQVWERLVMQKSKWQGFNRCWSRRSSLAYPVEGSGWERCLPETWEPVGVGVGRWESYHLFTLQLRYNLATKWPNGLNLPKWFCIFLHQFSGQDSNHSVSWGRPSDFASSHFAWLRKWDAGKPHIHCPQLETPVPKPKEFTAITRPGKR